MLLPTAVRGKMNLLYINVLPWLLYIGATTTNAVEGERERERERDRERERRERE